MKKKSSILVNKTSITSIAIGGFDGMHLAHQELFNKLDDNGAIIVIENSYASLTPHIYRKEYSKFPIYYYSLDDIKHLDGKEFIEILMLEFSKLKKIVVGYDFHFGKNRMYSIIDLKELFNGELVVVDEIKFNGLDIHSRTIREYISNSQIETANKLLNRNYKIYCTKIKGQGLGEVFFVPTINLKVEEFLLPSNGVYISKTILNKKSYNSISFLGHRETTDGLFAIETHILNEYISCNEHSIQVEFIKKIRDNKKFNSFNELKIQINNDIKEAIIFFDKNYLELKSRL